MTHAALYGFCLSHSRLTRCSFLDAGRFFLFSAWSLFFLFLFIPNYAGAAESYFVNALVVGLGSDGSQPSGMEEKQVYWDVNEDGFAEKCSWIVGNKAFLSLDKNGNGKVDGQNELFGSVAESGFVALAVYDENKDGEISAADPVFSKLSLWQDKNLDGKGQSGELAPLSAFGITKISLETAPVGNRETTDSKTGDVERPRPDVSNTIRIFNVRLGFNPLNTTDIKSYTLDPAVLLLPNLRGYGQITDLFIAMSRNPELKEKVKILAMMKVEDFFAPDFDFDQSFQDILLCWGGADKVDPASRGPNIDARKLVYLEALMAQPFEDIRGSRNPAPKAASFLMKAYDESFVAQKHHMAYQLPGIQKLFKKFPGYDYASDELRGSYELDVDMLIALTAIDSFKDRLDAWLRVLRFVEDIADEKIPGLRDVLNGAIVSSDRSGLLDYQRIKKYGAVRAEHPGFPRLFAFVWSYFY